MNHAGRLLVVAALPAFATACDECAGTVSCHNTPRISYSGQFIEHKSGESIGDVRVTFQRTSGIPLVNDRVEATSSSGGFFTLRGASVFDGTVVGDLTVTPPRHEPYTLTGVALQTSRTRGDGGHLGRFVVNPYLLLVGHVRDSVTLTPIPGATVHVRRTGGGQLAQDSATFETDFGGQFAWVDPEILQRDTIEFEFEIHAPGYPAPQFVTQRVPLQFRDQELAFVILPVGPAVGPTPNGSTVRKSLRFAPIGPISPIYLLEQTTRKNFASGPKCSSRPTSSLVACR